MQGGLTAADPWKGSEEGGQGSVLALQENLLSKPLHILKEGTPASMINDSTGQVNCDFSLFLDGYFDWSSPRFSHLRPASERLHQWTQL